MNGKYVAVISLTGSTLRSRTAVTQAGGDAQLGQPAGSAQNGAVRLNVRNACRAERLALFVPAAT